MITAHGKSWRMHRGWSRLDLHVQYGAPYERDLLEHVTAMDLSGTAVDVGANVGMHMLWFALICELQVEAFEPIWSAWTTANIELNGIGDRVTVHPTALGSADGRLVHAGRGRLAYGDGEIPVHTLDSYAFTNVTLIKIDVEGMEADVLRGGEATIRRDRPVIFAEEWADSPQWHDAIAAVLEPWGYQMTHHFAGRESPAPVGKWEHTR